MTLDEKARQPLTELIAAGDSVESLYAALKEAFEGESMVVGSPAALKTLRVVVGTDVNIDACAFLRKGRNHSRDGYDSDVVGF